MNVDGSEPIRLTDPDEGSHRGPAWSPDGSRITFVAQKSRGSDIYVMNAEGWGLVHASG